MSFCGESWRWCFRLLASSPWLDRLFSVDPEELLLDDTPTVRIIQPCVRSLSLSFSSRTVALGSSVISYFVLFHVHVRVVADIMCVGCNYAIIKGWWSRYASHNQRLHEILHIQMELSMRNVDETAGFYKYTLLTKTAQDRPDRIIYNVSSQLWLQHVFTSHQVAVIFTNPFDTA